jgi:hypothetical protein
MSHDRNDIVCNGWKRTRVANKSVNADAAQASRRENQGHETDHFAAAQPRDSARWRNKEFQIGKHTESRPRIYSVPRYCRG